MFRLPKWVPIALAFGLAVNVLLLTGAAVLSGEADGQEQDITAPMAVNTLNFEQTPPPAEEAAAEPEAPKREEARPDLGPDLFQPDFAPDFGGMGGVGDAIAIDLTGGANTAMKSDFVFESYELDQAPRAVVKMPPQYPFKAREKGIEGVVQVRVLVKEDGTVGEVLIMDARPPDTFEDAVLMAVPRWRFEPGVVGGKKVTSWVVTALHFKLN
ncbi:MAG TPA: energy transducer TonB [Candidatus Krumholzibacteria bacterium]|nr:energy transducer TonB [Candidatus Krumholzibacteria bacterium]